MEKMQKLTIMENDDLPGQPASGSVRLYYFRTRYLYILGFLQIFFGLAVMAIEFSAIGIFYHETLSYPLEIIGVFCGLLFIIAGYITFLAGRNKIAPATRHRLFIIGTILSFLALAAAIAMLVFCVIRAEKKYTEARDKEGREDKKGEIFKTPYAISVEGFRHTAHLRSIASVFYCLVAILFLPSLIIHVINIGKNKENLDTGFHDSTKSPFIFPSKNRA
ncbi:uncharacterized protein LOC129581282 [Paramacrobiotus metropolitanus]|uniref:uncharacterized protein LOC129581282 n=1 Tax=Paramacrobiotus metropolitanus TaxID=2943436 RepID=UPI0024459600|nr:uncharacterized protein LOC129581282 [Paramacrobiotus metropolitanus]